MSYIDDTKINDRGIRDTKEAHDMAEEVSESVRRRWQIMDGGELSAQVVCFDALGTTGNRHLTRLRHNERQEQFKCFC